LAGVWSLESGGQFFFFVAVFGKNLFSVAMRAFSHLICIIKKFYTFCTLSATCKDSAAINCTVLLLNTNTLHSRKFHGSYYADCSNKPYTSCATITGSITLKVYRIDGLLRETALVQNGPLIVSVASLQAKLHSQKGSVIPTNIALV
jgi:hypothetical protein